MRVLPHAIVNPQPLLPFCLHPRGNLVLVGDLMRSVSLLSYNAEQGTLEHRAADYSSGWTTAVEVRMRASLCALTSAGGYLLQGRPWGVQKG